jgi:hypothetical protein
MDWLKTIAPTVATALGGPLAGMAVSAIAKAIGCSPDEVQDVISSGKLTAEQVASIQLAELELKKQAQSMNLDFAKLIAEDKKSILSFYTSMGQAVPTVKQFINQNSSNFMVIYYLFHSFFPKVIMTVVM